MHYRGNGVLQDYKTAVKWLTLAAKQGNVEAQTMLGALYYKGDGVLQDIVYAHMWLNIASSNGSESGVKLRDMFAESITPSQL